MTSHSTRDHGGFTSDDTTLRRHVRGRSAIFLPGISATLEEDASVRRYLAHVQEIASVEVLNDVVLNQVLVRFGDDAVTAAVIEHVPRKGGHADLDRGLADDGARHRPLGRGDPRCDPSVAIPSRVWATCASAYRQSMHC
jgi:hypothetical protein